MKSTNTMAKVGTVKLPKKASKPSATVKKSIASSSRNISKRNALSPSKTKSNAHLSSKRVNMLVNNVTASPQSNKKPKALLTTPGGSKMHSPSKTRSRANSPVKVNKSPSGKRGSSVKQKPESSRKVTNQLNKSVNGLSPMKNTVNAISPKKGATLVKQRGGRGKKPSSTSPTKRVSNPAAKVQNHVSPFTSKKRGRSRSPEKVQKQQINSPRKSSRTQLSSKGKKPIVKRGKPSRKSKKILKTSLTKRASGSSSPTKVQNSMTQQRRSQSPEKNQKQEVKTPLKTRGRVSSPKGKKPPAKRGKPSHKSKKILKTSPTKRASGFNSPTKNQNSMTQRGRSKSPEKVQNQQVKLALNTRGRVSSSKGKKLSPSPAKNRQRSNSPLKIQNHSPSKKRKRSNSPVKGKKERSKSPAKKRERLSKSPTKNISTSPLKVQNRVIRQSPSKKRERSKSPEKVLKQQVKTPRKTRGRVSSPKGKNPLGKSPVKRGKPSFTKGKKILKRASVANSPTKVHNNMSPRGRSKSPEKKSPVKSKGKPSKGTKRMSQSPAKNSPSKSPVKIEKSPIKKSLPIKAGGPKKGRGIPKSHNKEQESPTKGMKHVSTLIKKSVKVQKSPITKKRSSSSAPKVKQATKSPHKASRSQSPKKVQKSPSPPPARKRNASPAKSTQSPAKKPKLAKTASASKPKTKKSPGKLKIKIGGLFNKPEKIKSTITIGKRSKVARKGKEPNRTSKSPIKSKPAAKRTPKSANKSVAKIGKSAGSAKSSKGNKSPLKSSSKPATPRTSKPNKNGSPVSIKSPKKILFKKAARK